MFSTFYWLDCMNCSWIVDSDKLFWKLTRQLYSEGFLLEVEDETYNLQCFKNDAKF